MKWLLGTYTMRFNRRHRVGGHLFAGRYKSLLIDESEPSYLRTACDYVHLNPARALILKAEEPLETYEWSSYPSCLAAVRARPGWLRCDRVLGEHGLEEGNRWHRREFSRRMEAQRGEGEPEEVQEIRRGWALGAEVRSNLPNSKRVASRPSPLLSVAC